MTHAPPRVAPVLLRRSDKNRYSCCPPGRAQNLRASRPPPVGVLDTLAADHCTLHPSSAASERFSSLRDLHFQCLARSLRNSVHLLRGWLCARASALGYCMYARIFVLHVRAASSSLRSSSRTSRWTPRCASSSSTSICRCACCRCFLLCFCNGLRCSLVLSALSAHHVHFRPAPGPATGADLVAEGARRRAESLPWSYILEMDTDMDGRRATDIEQRP